MKLLFKLAFRELRNSKRFCLFFVLNFSLGILGFLTLHSFESSINKSLALRSKTLLGSDLSITSRRAFKKVERDNVYSYLSPFIKKESFVNTLYSMGQSQGKEKQSRLLMIKMIAGSYPLYGSLKLNNQGYVNQRLKEKLKENKFVWISREVSHQLKLYVGDSLKLGNVVFRVDDIIESDSSVGAGGISLAPKLYIHFKYGDKLGLLSSGSISNYTHQFALNTLGLKKREIIQKKIFTILDDPSFKVLTPGESSGQVGRVLKYLSDYLGLVALVALFLATIGSTFLLSDFVFSKIIDIGILKSLGMSRQNILWMFVIQLSTLGLLSVSIASIVAIIILPLSSNIVSKLLGSSIDLSVSFDSMLVSYCVGIGLTFIICYPIIEKLILRKSHTLFAGEKNLVWRFERRDLLKFLPVFISMELLSVWQSHSIVVGTIFTFVITLVTLVLFALIPFVLKIVEKKFIVKSRISQGIGGLEFGLGVRLLSRNIGMSTLTFLSISIGVMLLSIISQLEMSLHHELSADTTHKPGLFLFDIQAEQKDELIAFSKQNKIPLRNLSPLVRARILKVDGVDFRREISDKNFRTREEEQRTRFRNRGVNLTYSNSLNESQTIVQGNPFKGLYKGSGLFEISLEKRFAAKISAEVGSRITLDILGLELTGVVTSLRSIKWTSFTPNFFITLQEGVVEDAPQSFLGVIESRKPNRLLEIQDLIVEKFSNISMINVTKLLDQVKKIFNAMSVAIKYMAYLCILVGLFVVYAIIQNQLRKQKYDILLLKSFGLKEFCILKVFCISFLLIAISATMLGAGLSIIVGNLLAQLIFDGAYQINWIYLVLTVAVVSAMTVFLVLLNGSRVYKKPIRSLLE